MSRAIELADELEALDKGMLTSMWAREGDKAVVAELRRLDRVNAELANLLANLHATVWGECPSLLNEDSGGNSALDLDIRAALTSSTGEPK